MSRIVDIQRKKINLDKFYDRKWYGKVLNQYAKNLCDKYFKDLVKIITEDPTKVSKNIDHIRDALKTNFAFRTHTLFFLHKSVYDSIFADRNDELPFEIFIKHYIDKTFICGFRRQQDFFRCILDENSILFHCGLFCDSLGDMDHLKFSICVIPYKYDEKFKDSNKLIHVDHSEFYDRDEIGHVIKVNDKTMDFLQAWFDKICLSIENQDEDGQKICSLKSLQHEIEYSNDTHFTLKYFSVDKNLFVHDINVPVPADVLQTAVKQNREKFNKTIIDHKSKFYNCSFYMIEQGNRGPCASLRIKINVLGKPE